MFIKKYFYIVAVIVKEKTPFQALKTQLEPKYFMGFSESGTNQQHRLNMHNIAQEYLSKPFETLWEQSIAKP